MKKKINFIMAFFLIAMVSLYFFNECKTKNLVQDFFDTDSLAEETHDISIIDTERNVKTIKKDSTVFTNFINSLEQLEIKRTSSNFTYTGFSLIIYHNNDLHVIYLSENGLLTFNHKNYEIQNKQAFDKFFEIVKAPNKGCFFYKGIEPPLDVITKFNRNISFIINENS